jgi:hypothetical protein
MINLAAFNKYTVRAFSILVGLIILQGCGGQRDEPFDPGTSHSSRGAAVTISKLISGDAPFTAVAAEGRLVKIRDLDSFEVYWDEYTNDPHDTVAFDTGQVLLVDLGEKNACERKLTLKQYAAYEGSVNSVIVVLDYTDADASSNSSSSTSSERSSSNSSSNSSCSTVGTTHPFYFYYVKSRDEIVIEENVP